jgi:hypothetical protein
MPAVYTVPFQSGKEKPLVPILIIFLLARIMESGFGTRRLKNRTNKRRLSTLMLPPPPLSSPSLGERMKVRGIELQGCFRLKEIHE